MIRSLVSEKLFDHPERSLRGKTTHKSARTITMTYGFKLDDSFKLPNVKGADDASKAWWHSISDIRSNRDNIFEDHLDIIEYHLKFMNR